MWKTQAPLFWTYVRKPLACWNHTNRTVFFWDGFMLPGPDALKLSKHSYSHVVFYIRAPGSFGISGFYSYKQWWFVSSSSFCSAAQWYCCCLETFSSLTHSVAGDKLQLWPGVGRKQLRGHSSACPALAAVTQRGAQHLWDSRWEHWVPAAGRTRSLEPCTLPQWWFQTQDLWYFPYMLAMNLTLPLQDFFFFSGLFWSFQQSGLQHSCTSHCQKAWGRGHFIQRTWAVHETIMTLQPMLSVEDGILLHRGASWLWIKTQHALYSWDCQALRFCSLICTTKMKFWPNLVKEMIFLLWEKAKHLLNWFIWSDPLLIPFI